MLTTHGFPKSGTHALVKACELLDVPWPCGAEHRTFAEGLDDGVTHDVFIVRDPRDVVVSMMRMDGQPVTPGLFIARFRRFIAAPLVDEMAAYQPWLQHSGHIVRYEALVASERPMRALASYLGVAYPQGAWEHLPRLTRTWNDTRSDYRTVWTPEAKSVWKREGGRALVEAWGYAWNS